MSTTWVHLPRRQFVTLNRLRCGQARCAESLYRWGVIASLACPCGESHQTTRHIVEECPLTAFPGGLRHLHKAGPDAVKSAHSLHSLEACDIYTKRVLMQSRVSTHCIPWRPATSTRSGSRCSQECPLIAFPGGLRHLHEAGPDAVKSAHSLHSLEACDVYTKQVQMQSRVPTHCIPWRPATSTRSGSRCSGMVIKTVTLSR